MKVLTLAFLFRGDKMLLAMKKRSFGVGNWNGYGGKLNDGESPVDGVIREIKEEGDLDIDKSFCKEIGEMNFYFSDKKEWDQKVIVYRIDNFSGEPKETEEMKPKWFDINEIPYHEMWAGDDKWIPFVIRGESFSGEVHFANEGKKVITLKINKTI